MTMHLEIVTPKGSVIDIEAEEVVLPGKQGEFTILDGHIPFLSALKPGVIAYIDDDGEHRMAIGTGFSEAGVELADGTSHHKVLVLTNMHAFEEDVDVDEVRAELEEVQEELKAWTTELDKGHQKLEEKAQWAEARLLVKGVE